MTNFTNFLGTIFSSANLGDYDYLKSIVDFLDEIVIPTTIVLSIAAAVFSACIAFMIIKAESAEKAEEMKKRLFGIIITFVVVIVVVWILGLVLSNFSTIMETIRNIGSGLTA